MFDMSEDFVFMSCTAGFDISHITILVPPLTGSSAFTFQGIGILSTQLKNHAQYRKNTSFKK